MKSHNSRVISVFIIIGIIAVCCARANCGELTSFAEYKSERNLKLDKYCKLINPPHGCSASKITEIKMIELVKGIKPVLLIKYKSPDTIPHSKSVCGYVEIEPNKFKLIIPDINLFYGEYRGNNPYEYHDLYISDINNDGNKEIIVFEKVGTEPYYLSGIYFYLEEKKVFVFSSLINQRIPKEKFHISQAANLMKNAGYSFSPGLTNIIVSIE